MSKVIILIIMILLACGILLMLRAERSPKSSKEDSTEDQLTPPWQ